MKNNTKNFEKVQFLLIGIILIVTGSVGSTNHPVLGYFTMLLGVLLLFYSAYIHAKGKTDRNLKTIALFCEALALLVAAIMLLNEGKIYLPYIYFAASGGYIIATSVYFFKMKKSVSLFDNSPSNQ